jgi:hypothetical protein
MPLAVSSPPFVLGLVDTKFRFYDFSRTRRLAEIVASFAQNFPDLCNERSDGKGGIRTHERRREKASDFGLKHHFASSEAFALVLPDIVC